MQYFFHIRVSDTLLIDEEGLEFQDISAARAEMRASAMDLTKAALRSGPDVEHGIIELEDESGNIVETFPIRAVCTEQALARNADPARENIGLFCDP